MPITLTRSILAILLPGGIAVAPWLLMTVVGWPDLGSFYATYSILGNVILVGTMIVIGKIFEAYASSIEERWDAERESEFEVKENWYKYLARSIDPEPVGYRYLSRVITALYFELTMAFALVVFFTGCVTYFAMADFESRGIALVASMFLGVSAPDYFVKQAKLSHEALCKVRKQINERLEAA